MITKKCSQCRKFKLLNEFYKNPQVGNKDLLHSWCKKCHNKGNSKSYYKRRKENPQQLRDYANKYRSKNKERINSLSRKSHEKIRYEVLKKYSNGLSKCACCGEKEYKFLAIDHINGGGLKHLRKIGNNILGWIRKNNYPKGFQILCHNCNFAKGHYGKCPHIK